MVSNIPSIKSQNKFLYKYQYIVSWRQLFGVTIWEYQNLQIKKKIFYHVPFKNIRSEPGRRCESLNRVRFHCWR
jgi:hypothetical protein